MKNKKVVTVAIPSEIYTNFLPSGTVVDRPGLPLLKIMEAAPMMDGRISVAVEVSPSNRKKSKET